MFNLPRPSRTLIPAVALLALLGARAAGGVLAAPTPTVAPSSDATTSSAPAAPTATPAPATTPGAATTSPRRPGGTGNPGSFPGPRGQRGDPIARASSTIDKAKADLASAQGKMDVTQVQGWLNLAATTLTAAQTAQTNNQTFQARANAGAAQELALAADTLIRAKLGTAAPTPTSRPSGTRGGTPVSPQARTSRSMAATYRGLIAERDALAPASLGASWSGILSDAEGLYKDAYAAYNAGSYDQVALDVRAASRLTHAMGLAVSATTNPNQPVSVPAPNF